jgi:hypothetical protein
MKSLILILAFFSASAFAQSKQDGNELLIGLKNPTSIFQEALIKGYISATADISLNICPAANVTNGQLYDVVQNYLENNPARRHLHRSILVEQALTIAFPCK